MRGKKERKGTGEGKGHEKRKSPKTLTGTVSVALPVWLCHPPHCSHLHLTLISHFTPHTAHFTPPLLFHHHHHHHHHQHSEAPRLLRDRRLSSLAGALVPSEPPRPSGVVPPAARKGLPWQNANLPASQVHSDPEPGQETHLPLACLVGQSRFDWYQACSQGFATPLQLRISQRHASLALSPHNK